MYRISYSMLEQVFWDKTVDVISRLTRFRYLSCNDYSFVLRSLLSRDQKGHLVAGLYFPVGARGKDAQFTLFFDNGAEKRKTKYKFSTFADPSNVSIHRLRITPCWVLGISLLPASSNCASDEEASAASFKIDVIWRV